MKSGVVSILLFWGFLETGVAIVASCLPVLSPLFRCLSLESIIRSFRSAISLRSMGSSSKSSLKKHGAPGAESETAIAGFPSSGYPPNDMISIDVEAYAMGRVDGEKQGAENVGTAGIWRETEVKQSSEQFV